MSAPCFCRFPLSSCRVGYMHRCPECGTYWRRVRGGWERTSKLVGAIHPLNVVRRWQTRNNRRVLAAIPHGRWVTALATARSAGVRNPSRIYPALQRLQDAGLIEARWVPQYAPADRRRCYYTRTEAPA